jgi:drug/metabolite transporter (DMT)-like permease
MMRAVIAQLLSSADADEDRRYRAEDAVRGRFSLPTSWRTLLPASAGALLIAFSAIFVRLAQVSPSTATVFRCAYALPLLGVLAAREHRRYGPRPAAARRASLAAGLLFAMDLTFWHHSIAAVGAGLATVLANVQVLFVALLAWALLAERPDRRTLACLPLMLAGIVLISGAIGAGAYGTNPPLGALYGLCTALAYAGFLLLLRRGNQDLHRPAGPLFDATAVAAVAATVGGVFLDGVDPLPPWPAQGWLALLAITCQVIAWLLISVSLPRLPAVLTSALLLLQPVGAVLLGVVLLGEAPSPIQLTGVAAVLAGVLIVTTARSLPLKAPAG